MCCIQQNIENVHTTRWEVLKHNLFSFENNNVCAYPEHNIHFSTLNTCDGYLIIACDGSEYTVSLQRSLEEQNLLPGAELSPIAYSSRKMDLYHTRCHRDIVRASWIHGYGHGQFRRCAGVSLFEHKYEYDNCSNDDGNSDA